MPRLRSIATYWSTLTKSCSVRRTFRMPLVSSLILAILLLSSPGKGEIIDRIVAIVNDDIITLSELEGFRKSLYPPLPKKHDWLSKELDLLDARHQVLNALIEERLIDQEAERQGIQVAEKQLKDTVESLKQERGLSQAQLERALQAEGLTYEDYTEEVAKRLRRTQLINRVVRSKTEINEKDLKAYYEAHVSEYMANESVRISHILLPLSPNPTKDKEEAALSTAKDILAKIENGEDFAALTREYSRNIPGVKGGDMGYFKRGEMIPAIEKTAFSLSVGEVGGIIRTSKGVLLIKVTDRTGGSPIPLAEIREKVERDYYAHEAEQRYRKWLNKLKERSFIEVKL